MSNSSGINSRSNRTTPLQTAQPIPIPTSVSTEHGGRTPSKIERGIRLNPMQKDFLTKFESMRRDAQDLSAAFSHPAAANSPTLQPRVLVPLKKVHKK